MSELKKVSAADLATAKRAKGKLRKAPKKPKRNASLLVLENYIAKHNAWVDMVKKKADDLKKKETLKKRVFGV